MDDVKTYSSKIVAKRLSIEPVTVRKYSNLLEKQGFEFQRDENNWRKYNDDDIAYLKYVCDMKLQGKSLNESIEHVASLYRSNLNITNTDISLQDKKQNALFEFMKHQEKINLEILERLENQEQRQIERDQNLMYAINQSLETRKQIAIAKEKKWWMFWK